MSNPSQDWLSLENCRVDLERGTIVGHQDGESLGSLTTMERRLITHLARNADRPIARNELLEKVWGYNGNVITRTVDVAIRRLRSKLERDAANPTHIITIHGLGYRFAGPVPDVRQLEATSIPPELTPLVGRVADVAAVRETIASGARVLTITGAGGIGKSALALHIGHGCDTPVVYVDLTDTTDDTSTVSAIASALGVYLNGSTVEAAMERVRQPLVRLGDALIVLDNADGICPSIRRLLATWLVGTETTFMVTSRTVLRLAGEHVHRIGPLSMTAGIDLFTQRQRQRRGALGSQDDLEPLMTALDGNPLAIELAAARASFLTPTQLLRRLDQRFTLLQASPGEVQHRHASLRQVIDTSWSWLTETERTVACRCAVFRGSFDLDAVTVILDDTAFETVEALVDHSLLRLQETPTGVRLRMDESVRAYAREQLGTDIGAIQNAHATYFGDWGMHQRKHLRRANGHAALTRLNTERDNLLSALENTETPTTALKLGLALFDLGTARGPLSVRDQAVRRALEIGQSGDPLLLAELLVTRMEPMRSVRDPDALHRELDVAETLSVTNTAARACVDMARAELAYRLGNVAEALTLVHDAGPLLPPTRRTDGQLLEARCHQRLGDDDAARPVFDAALAAFTRTGDLLGEARTRFYASFLDERAGRIERAAERLQRACERFGDMGNVAGEAVARVTLAGVYLDHGHNAKAQEQLDKAVQLARSIGDLYSEGIASINLGNLHLSLGDRTAAATSFRSAVGLLYQQGAPADEAVALANLGIAERDQGLLVLALQRCSELDLDMLSSIAHAWLAALQAIESQPIQAAANLEKARTLANPASQGTVDILARVVEGKSSRDTPPPIRVDERIAYHFASE
jgi:predicted ATPase/DNA-binding winged helix-turn-helix (wHTH) protein/Tfp pilus assembly protein PilF